MTRKIRYGKKIKSMCCLLLTLSLCGCAGSGQEMGEEDIVLLDPVNTAAEYEEAACRTIYDVTVYSGSVFPYVAEYSFAENEKFAGYGALPGESVKKGDTLVYSDSESIDAKIEALEKKIDSMDEEYLTYKQELEEEWSVSKYTRESYKSVYENCLRNEPAPYVETPEEDGENAEGGESTGENRSTAQTYEEWQHSYTIWQQQTHEWEGKYRKLAYSIELQEKALEQKTALYELDRAYQVKQLTRLKEQKANGSITTGMDGEIVAIRDLTYGNSVEKETSLVAVGNTGRKVLKCNYINSSVIAKAEEIYALINGKRCEVEYQALLAEEYNELTSAGETVYSTFYLAEPEEAEIGDFAVIVVVAGRKENALSVPKEAIHKDEAGRYVYVLENGESIYTYVEIGVSDGAYTEITYGLTAGQKVLLTGETGYEGETVQVKKGSFSSTFEGKGYMYYPASRMVQNPIEHGTVYFTEMLVSKYQHVEKGDVIAKVHVQMDEMEYKRLQTSLQRQKERLADYIEQNGADTSEEAAKTIAAKQEAIEKLEEQIAQIEADAKTGEIVSDQTGIVIWAAEHEEEDILYQTENLIQVADEETCYVIVENTNQLLNYGNKVSIRYEDKEGKEKSAEGMVASISAAGVSKAIDTEYSMILLPSDVIADMAVATEGYGGWWNRNRYTITAVIRQMDNVLVVPKSAVREIAGNTYVYVKEEDGSVTARSFVAGGFDSKNYWIVEGLTEGMNVCLK